MDCPLQSTYKQSFKSHCERSENGGKKTGKEKSENKLM